MTDAVRNWGVPVDWSAHRLQLHRRRLPAVLGRPKTGLETGCRLYAQNSGFSVGFPAQDVRQQLCRHALQVIGHWQASSE
jgi:hypothetical protein